MANRKRDEQVDTIRTMYWFEFLMVHLEVKTAFEVRQLIELDWQGKDRNGDTIRSSKYPEYEAGKHVPRSQMIALAETAVPNSAAIIEHVLWDLLRSASMPLGKNALLFLRRLPSSIQKLVEAPNNQIRLNDASNHLRALERRHSLDGIALLTLLLRLSLEREDQQLAKEYASSLLKVLLAFGMDLFVYRVSDNLFDVFVSRLFNRVRWDGVRFDLSNYEFSFLSVKLFLIVEGRLRRGREVGNHENRTKVTCAILAGTYAQNFYPHLAPLVVPDLDLGPPTQDSLERWLTHAKAKEV